MTVYIPLWAIFYILCVYVAVGIMLYVPLYRWSDSFVHHPYRRAEWYATRTSTLIRGVFMCGLFWPIMTGALVHEQYKAWKAGRWSLF